MILYTVTTILVTGGSKSAFSSPVSEASPGVHSAFLPQHPFSMEALLSRPQLTTGIIPHVNPISQKPQRQFSFPPTTTQSAANPYLNYQLPSAFAPSAAAMTPFFMSHLAAAGMSAFSGHLRPKQLDSRFSDIDSDEESHRK